MTLRQALTMIVVAVLVLLSDNHLVNITAAASCCSQVVQHPWSKAFAHDWAGIVTCSAVAKRLVPICSVANAYLLLFAIAMFDAAWCGYSWTTSTSSASAVACAEHVAKLQQWINWLLLYVSGVLLRC
eukprot:11370-Heterococcus_DN1.PRE.6